MLGFLAFIMQQLFTIMQYQAVLDSVATYGTPLNISINHRTYGALSIAFAAYMKSDITAHVKTSGTSNLGFVFGASIIRDDSIPFNTIVVNWE